MSLREGEKTRVKEKPQKITHEQALEVIDTRKLLGLFYFAAPTGVWIGIDNLTGNAWTEEFHRKRKCLAWLRHEFEVGDMD